jgi:DNA primase large subunit
MPTPTFTKDDRAHYPFLPQTAEYMRPLDLTIQDITSLRKILEHAEKRIVASFDRSLRTPNAMKEPDIEIASFPVAIMMVSAIGDKYLKKRYALHEAKQIYTHLQDEKPERIMEIAKFFKWNITQPETGPYSFALHFVNYVKNSTVIQEPEWKLINRQLNQGRVYITRHEAVRLLQEEIRRHIEAKLDTKVTKLPPQIRETVERLENTFTAQKGTIRQQEYPQTTEPEAFPPCIKALHNSLNSGHHLSHTGRFTLTTFLVNTGMPTETILDLYRNLSDFNERLTRYQIEHIAGERGSRTRYQPPRCSTLRTHGVCTNPDNDCRNAGTPLACYRRKLRRKKG